MWPDGINLKIPAVLYRIDETLAAMESMAMGIDEILVSASL